MTLPSTRLCGSLASLIRIEFRRIHGVYVAIQQPEGPRTIWRRMLFQTYRHLGCGPTIAPRHAGGSLLTLDLTPSISFAKPEEEPKNKEWGVAATMDGVQPSLGDWRSVGPVDADV